MKFSEKLIKLRKEKLLSQEELGEKLNVTRQTVSKWELGQTTPDMEKLVEMSKLFGVSLDELTSESELNTDNPIKEKNHTSKNIIIIILLIVLLLVCVGMVTTKIIGKGFGLFKGIIDRHEYITEQVQNHISNVQSRIDSEMNSTQEQTENFDDMIDSIKKTYGTDEKSFNRTFEIRGGTHNGPAVQWLIDDVIQNNQTNDRVVTVKYNDTYAKEPSELRTLKRSFDNGFDKFEVYFEYAEDGFIYKAIIEKI